MADWFFDIQGVRDSVEIELVTPMAGAKPVGPFGMLGALSSKEARQGLGVLMELTKAMGWLKNGGSTTVEQSGPIA